MIKRKVRNGFSLIELMVVMVIIGILISIALPQFDAARTRAGYASLKSNMHTTQLIAETYSTGWGGIYPKNSTELFTEATNKKFWKDFKNPFKNAYDPITDMSAVTSAGTASSFAGGVLFGGKGSTTNGYINNFYNAPLDNGTYVIYAIDRVGALFQQGTSGGVIKPYYFSNN